MFHRSEKKELSSKSSLAQPEQRRESGTRVWTSSSVPATDRTGTQRNPVTASSNPTEPKRRCPKARAIAFPIRKVIIDIKNTVKEKLEELVEEECVCVWRRGGGHPSVTHFILHQQTERGEKLMNNGGETGDNAPPNTHTHAVLFILLLLLLLHVWDRTY